MLGHRQSTIEPSPTLVNEKEQLQSVYENVRKGEERLEELEGQIATHEDLSDKIKNLGKELAELKDSKEAEIEELEAKHEILAETYKQDRSQKNNEMVEIEKTLVVRHVELDKLDKTISQQTAAGSAEVNRLINVKVGLEEDVQYLEAKKSTGTALLGELEQKTTKAQQDQILVESLLGSVRRQRVEEETQLSKLQDEREVSADKLFNLNADIKEAEIKLQSVNKEITEKSEGLTKREGELSIREQLLQEKREKLIKAKEQLEGYFNKPLHNLII